MAGPFNFADTLIAQGRWQAEQNRQDERMAWERADRAYRDSERKRTSDARSALENTIAGMDTSSQRDIGAAGYTPDQIATGVAAQGGARAFADQVARYQNDFDSSDLATGGAGERVAAGLPLQGSKVNPAAVKAPRKSELAGARAKYALAMGQDPGAALADQDAALTQERMRDWFGQFSHVSDEALLDPKTPYGKMLRPMLNDNAGAKGSVGYDPETKKYVVTDYNGNGDVQRLSRSELMQAAYQKFLESEGRIPESIALGIGREDRKRTRNREDARDTNEGQKLAFGMNMDNKKFGLAEQELADNRDFRSQSLGLQREGLNLRRTELDRTHPTMSPADRTALMDIERKWYAETDPAKKTALERQYQMVTSRAALNMGKVLGLPSGRGAKPIDEQTVMGYVEQLRADPNHQGKNVFELRQMVLDNLQGGAGQDLVVPGGGRLGGATAPTAGTPPPGGPVSDGRKNFGTLTSRADLEREVAAGNPYAIRYMDAQRENRINAELSAGNPNYGINY